MARSIASQIKDYLVKHPRKEIPLAVMFDSLQIYTVNTATGHKSYTPGSIPMRHLIFGGPPSPWSPDGTPPMEGLEVVHKVTSARGNKGGLEWSKCSVRYNPPKGVQAPVPEPEQDPLPEAFTNAFTPQVGRPAPDYSEVLSRVSGNVVSLVGHLASVSEKAGYHSVLLNANVLAIDRVVDEQRKTNELLERLLKEWGSSTTS